MKLRTSPLGILLVGSLAFTANAITRYVDLNSPSPTAPYTSWATAATNIQDAVDAALAGDLVLVTNGTYQAGEGVVTGETNRVAITNAIEVRSVNGSAVTVIHGSQENGIRCIYLASGALLSGFTVTNGYAPTHGGGVWCESTNAVVTNCVLTGNTAYYTGGGVYRGTIKNCVISGNIANAGGGAFQSELMNCLLYENAAYAGGGAFECTVSNCTVTYNHAYAGRGSSPRGGGVASCASYNSIIYYNTSEDGEQYANYGWTSQVFGHCCTTPLPAVGINISDEPLFVDAFDRDFHLVSGSPCVDFGNNSYAPLGPDFEGNPRIVGLGVDMGAYEYQGPPHIPTTLYVSAASTSPVPPYTNWATAANVIQDALNVARNGDEVIVTNGVYRDGGSVSRGGASNRVAIIRNVTLRSVNGPAVTIIEGYQIPGDILGDAAVRCAYLDNGAKLTGFTLTLGATPLQYYPEGTREEFFAGGVFCTTTNEVVSNCIIASNVTSVVGGVYRGTIHNSILSNNRCDYVAGGALEAVLNNCLIIGNSAGYVGGAENCTLNNCTIVNNNALQRTGGVSDCELKNSILVDNSAPIWPNYYSVNAEYCCLSPLPAEGAGNFTDAPQFVNAVGGNFRLQTNSPCIDSGNNGFADSDVDLDGRSRTRGGIVDIGAYEFQGAGTGEFIGWLQEFGFATDGSADVADADGDRMNNYGEWRSDTIPTNAASVLRMIGATNSASGANVAWQSVPTRSYTLERSTNLGLASSFQTIATNIAGALGTKTFTDNSATNSGPYFYRVGVE